MAYKVVGNFNELDKWVGNIKQGCKEVDNVYTAAIKELAEAFLDIVEEKTPVGIVPYKIHEQHDEWVNDNPGELQRAWREDNATLKVVKQGNTYTLTLENKTPYASYIEYGHYQHVGQFVWWIESRLSKKFIRGRYFMTQTEVKIRQQDSAIMQRLVEIWLNEVVGT